MANKNEIALIIRANNTNAIAGIKDTNRALVDMSNKASSLTSLIKSEWMLFSVAAAGAFYTVKKIISEFAAAAEREERRMAFTNLAATFHSNADSIIADLKRMSGQSITTSRAIELAARPMLSGMDPRAMPGLMEFSKTLSNVIPGSNTADLFEDITRAIITGQDRMLNMKGITVDFDKAQQDLAKSLGTTKERLDEQHRQYANLTAFLETAITMTQRLGKEQQSTSDVYDKLSANISESWEGIKDGLFKAFGPLALGILRGFAENLRWINWYIDSVKGGINYIVDQYQRVKGLFSSDVGAGLKPAPTNELTGAHRGATSVKDLGFTFDEQLGPGLQSLKDYTEEMKSSLGEIAKEEKDLTKEATNQIKDREAAYKNMYDALRFDTEKYYTFQKGLLEKQLAEEIAITGDLELAWEAYYARLEELEEQRILRTNDFAGGIKAYYAELSREGFTWAQGAKDMMQDFASGGASAISGFLKKVETDTKNIGQHLKTFASDFAGSMLDAINDMIAKWLMFKIITGIGGAFMGGVGGGVGVGANQGASVGWGDVGVAHTGGYIPRFHAGGLSSDEVPAILQRGEYVINRNAVAAVGRQTLDGINRGDSGRGAGRAVSYSITIQNSFIDPTGIEKYKEAQERQIHNTIKKLRHENKI